MEQLITIPDIGNFKDVPIIEVLVKPGDTVSKDDSLITLESDKAAMEIPSPAAGTVKELRLQVGEKVSQGSPILVLTLAAAAETSAPAPASTATAPQASAPSSPAAAVPAVVLTAAESVPAAPSAVLAKPPEPVATESAGSLAHASPAIRRFARELGAEVEKIKGTGPKGRILKEDVQAYIKSRLQAPPASSMPGFNFPEVASVDFAQFGPIESQPLTRIQKLSGANLHRNWVSIPHVTYNEEADITDLEAFRVSLKAEAERQQLKLTLLPFLVKALANTLQAFPRFNASLSADGEALILKHYYHIGIAIDTPDGLVVPPIRDVDRKGIFDLAKELADIGERARSKKLRTQELQGGTFTISSLGGIGGTAFTPIINAPEVAILGVCRSQTKPVYRDGEFQPRLMLPLSMSFDHRVIDGAATARFCTHLAQNLADFRRVLL